MKRVPAWVVRILQLALVAVITYGIVRALAPELGKVSREDFAAWTPHAGLLIVSLLMVVGVYLLHCVLWRNITIHLGGVAPGWKASLRIYFVSSLGRYIPGKLWQIAGLAALANKACVSAVAATAASLTGQLAFLSSGLIYVAVVLPGWGGRAPLIGVVALAAAATGFYLFLRSRASSWLVERMGERGRGAFSLIARIGLRDAVQWWLAYALTWALLGAAFVLFVKSFAPLHGLQHLHVAGTVAAAYLFGYVSFFAPAGLGIREAVMLGLLTPVMPASGALVVSVASRLWFTAAELLPLALIPIARAEHAITTDGAG